MNKIESSPSQPARQVQCVQILAAGQFQPLAPKKSLEKVQAQVATITSHALFQTITSQKLEITKETSVSFVLQKTCVLVSKEGETNWKTIPLTEFGELGASISIAVAAAEEAVSSEEPKKDSGETQSLLQANQELQASLNQQQGILVTLQRENAVLKEQLASQQGTSEQTLQGLTQENQRLTQQISQLEPLRAEVEDLKKRATEADQARAAAEAAQTAEKKRHEEEMAALRAQLAAMQEQMAASKKVPTQKLPFTNHLFG